MLHGHVSSRLHDQVDYHHQKDPATMLNRCGKQMMQPQVHWNNCTNYSKTWNSPPDIFEPKGGSLSTQSHRSQNVPIPRVTISYFPLPKEVQPVPRVTISYFPAPKSVPSIPQNVNESSSSPLEYAMEFERWLQQKTTEDQQPFCGMGGNAEKNSETFQNNDEELEILKEFIATPKSSSQGQGQAKPCQIQPVIKSVVCSPTIQKNFDGGNDLVRVNSKNSQQNGGQVTITNSSIGIHKLHAQKNGTKSPEIICISDDPGSSSFQKKTKRTLAAPVKTKESVSSSSLPKKGHQQQNFLCKFCGGILPSYQTLKEHLANFHSDRKTFPCLVCSKIFTTMSMRQNHMKVHQRGWTFACKICHRFFAKAKFLYEHTAAFHRGVARLLNNNDNSNNNDTVRREPPMPKRL